MRKLSLSLSLLLVFAVAGVCFAAPKKTDAASKKSVAAPSLNGGKFAAGYVYNGFGLNASGVDAGSSIALRYDLSSVVNKLAVEGSFGFITGDGPDFFALGAKGIYDLQKYPSFDLYGFAGADYASLSSTSFMTLSVGAGIEYFILSNLSVSTEFGLGAVFGDNYTSFGIFGNWLSNLGVRYYFDM
jgi:hypothetical protein